MAVAGELQGLQVRLEAAQMGVERGVVEPAVGVGEHPQQAIALE